MNGYNSPLMNEDDLLTNLRQNQGGQGGFLQSAAPGMPDNFNFGKLSALLGLGGQGGGAPSQMWGNVNQSLQTVSGLADAWAGLKNLDLAKDQFKFSKSAFNTNLANQAKLTNTQLEDKHRLRLASTANPSQYQSLSAYMDDHRVSGDAI